MNIKRVLITQSQLKNLSGSEVLTLEIAEYYASQGVEVTILTHYTDNPMEALLDQVANVKIIKTGSHEADNLTVKDYDLLWIHHLTFTERMIQELHTAGSDRPYVVFNHMSSMQPLEFPILTDAELKLADVILFNSSETISNLEQKLGIEFPKSLAMNFMNPAPDDFYDNRRQSKDASKSLESVLVVSNHPPRSVEDAAVNLRRQGVRVEFIGRNRDGSEKRVTADLLKDFDVIITIGKTVQYSIACNVPIYCYDYFGGPGYLTEKNYEAAMDRNFSGRGFSKSSGNVIANDIVDNYVDAVKNMDEIHRKYSSELLLSYRMSLLNERLKKAKKSDNELTKKEANTMLAYTSNMNKFMPAYLLYIFELRDARQKIDMLEAEVRRKEERNDYLEEAVREVNSRKAVTFANFVKKMIKQFRKVIKNPRLVLVKSKSLLQKINARSSNRDKDALLNDSRYADLLYKTIPEKVSSLTFESVQAKLSNFNRIKIDWKGLVSRFKDTNTNASKVTVVVLVLNNFEMTKRCIDSLYKTKNNMKHDVVIVDNGSESETITGLRNLADKYQFKLVHVDQNVNFSLGNNIGFSFVETEYAVFLNNDTYVTDGWLDEIIDPLSDDKLKAVQPTLLYPDNTIQCMGVVFSAKSYIGYSLYAGIDAGVEAVRKSRKLQAVTAACIAVRSVEFARIKGFDPEFVNGQEDIDLCLRLTKEQGESCYCTSKSVVFHDEGKTPGRGKRVLLNRKTFLSRWKGMVRADDQFYYDEDGYHIDSWNIDSKESLIEGVEVYTPNLRKEA